VRYIFTIISIFCASLSAQTTADFEYCGHDKLVEDAKANHPAEYQEWENAYIKMAQSSRLQRRGIVEDTTFTLRVVVHLVYSNSTENISDALIHSQIQVLNESFGHYHADTANVRTLFKSRAGDIGIRFELAKTDSNGNPTTGIVRQVTTKSSFGSARTDVKFRKDGGSDAWDPTRYFNIWICDLSAGGSDNLLGFATPPSTHPFWTATGSGAYPLNEQGAVLHYKIVGVNNPLSSQVTSNPDKGRVAVHEVGHYLGLRHIWGDGLGSTGCTVDDFIEDTPNQSRSSNFACNKNSNTCNTGSDDEPNMVENYMDYSGDDCMVMFTAQQRTVMRSALTKYRPNIASKTEINRTYVRDDFTTSLNVYYNNDDRLTIDVNDDRLTDYSYSLYNLAGQKMGKDLPLNNTSQEVNFRNFADGLYVLQIKVKNQEEPILTQKVQNIK